MKVNLHLDLDEKVLQAIAFVQDRAAGKHSRGKRVATRADVQKWAADELNRVEEEAAALV